MPNGVYATIPLFVLLLTACGGDPSSTPANGAGGSASPTAGTAVSVSPSPTAPGEPLSAVAFTGKSSGSISGDVVHVEGARSFCGQQDLSADRKVFRLELDVTVAGKTRALYLTTTSPAPGTYSFVRPETPGAVAPADGGFVLQPHSGGSDTLTLFDGGSVTVAPGLKSGSIKATYLTRASKQKGTLTGNFTC